MRLVVKHRDFSTLIGDDIGQTEEDIVSQCIKALSNESGHVITFVEGRSVIVPTPVLRESIIMIHK